MMNIQHNQNCGHCERNGVTCAMFLALCADDKGDDFETPFYICYQCLTDGAAAVMAALSTGELETVSTPAGLKVKLGSALLCSTCLHDPCKCVQS